MALSQAGYSDPGILTRSGAGEDLVDKELDKMIMRYNSIPLQGAEFYRTESAPGGSYKEATYGNSLPQPRVNEDTDRLPKVSTVPGFRKSATLVSLRLAVEMTRRIKERDLQGKAMYMLSGLMDSARSQLELAFADEFNSNAFANDLGADGKDLCDDGHPFEDKTVTSSSGLPTWSNLETAGALTHTSMSTARKNMRKRTNERNRVMPVFMKRLVVPADLEQKAWEIKNSEKNPENVLNAKNWFNGIEWTVKVYDYLTSTTAWFLFGNIPKEQDGFVYVEEVAPNIASYVPSDNPDILHASRLRMSFDVMTTTSRNIQGNAGA